MDQRLRQLYRQYTAGELPAQRLMHEFARHGHPVELLYQTTTSDPVSVMINLYEDDEETVETFGIWDFGEPLVEMCEELLKRGQWPAHSTMQGTELLARIPEIIDVFQEAGIDLKNYQHSLYLEPDPIGGPYISFQTPDRQSAIDIFFLIQNKLGIPRNAISVRQYDKAGHVVFGEGDIVDTADQFVDTVGRITVATDLLPVIQERPPVEVTLDGIPLDGIIDHLRDSSEDLEVLLNNEFNRYRPARVGDVRVVPVINIGVVVYSGTNIVADTGNPDWDIRQDSNKKSDIRDATELFIEIQTDRLIYFLVTLAGTIINTTGDNVDIYGPQDFFESSNRWGRDVISLPQWAGEGY